MPGVINLYLLAQIIGYSAYALSAVALLHRKDRSYLNYSIASQCFWIVHYGLLDAKSGMMGMFISLWRSVGARFVTKEIWRFIVLMVLLFAYGAVAFFTVKTAFGVLPYLGSAIGSIGVLLSSGMRMRLCILCSSICWIIYSFFVGSIPGIVQEITMISFNLLTLYRMQKMSKIEALKVAV